MKKKPIALQVTHIFDKRAARLFKESAYEKSAPEKTGLKVATQQPPGRKGFFGQFYEREELPCFKKAPEGHGYFLPIDGVMVQHVLIEKKYLDEARYAISVALVSCSGCWSLGLKDIKLLEQALKNISVK